MTLDSYALLRQASFGLMDQLAIDSLPGNLPKHVLCPVWFRGDENLLPALVNLRDLGPSQAEVLLDDFDSARKSRQTPAVTQLLVTDADEAVLRRHLAHYLTIRHNHKPALFRYYDARVLQQLTWMLTVVQLNELLGPIERLAYWVGGEWHALDNTGEKQPGPRIDAQRIARIGAINEIVGDADRPGREVLLETSCGAEAALIRAEKHGLTDEDDRIAFARHVVSVHPRLDAHPTVAALLKSAEKGNPYRDAAALLSDGDWQRIVQELEHTATTRTVQ